jgi:hypothetical protein
MTSTFQRIFDPGNNMREEISLEHTCDWLSYYKHHKDMDDPKYVHEVPSDYLWPWMFYFSYHSQVDAPLYVIKM